jgi:CrcB protein
MPASSRARSTIATLAAVALGGSLGGIARFGAVSAWPVTPEAFPWPVFAVNIVGCLCIGVLMTTVEERLTRHPLARVFLGVGMLGGFTTFSAYALDTITLWRTGEPYVAAAYLGGTLLAGLGGVMAGMAATTAVLRLRRRNP